MKNQKWIGFRTNFSMLDALCLAKFLAIHLASDQISIVIRSCIREPDDFQPILKNSVDGRE
jgi:hypothetical protein